MNAIVLAILVMVALSLARVSVVFALVVASLVGGIYSGMSVSAVLDAFNEGLSNGASIALAYATLGAFAVALSRSGVTELLSAKAIERLGLDTDAPRRNGLYFVLLAILLAAAISSQNLIPVHIAFIPILVPPLLKLMNHLHMDRRAAACVITFGITAPYMLLPVGFGAIFLNGILLTNLNEAGSSLGLSVTPDMVPMAMVVPIAGMALGLLVAVTVSYRKRRNYEDRDLAHTAEGQAQVKARLDTARRLAPWQKAVLAIAILGTLVTQLVFDSMMLGGILGFAILSVSGVFHWREQDGIFTEGMRMLALIGFIMITASGFAGVMQATGEIERLVQSSVEIIGDNRGLAALIMLLVGLFITMGIGSSFSTIPIIASLYVPLALNFGFSPMATVALVGTAAALGDAGSPASDSTLGPTAGLNADGQHDHIWETCVPTFLHYNIPLIAFGWLAAMTL